MVYCVQSLILYHLLIAVGAHDQASVPVEPTSSNDPEPTTEGAYSFPAASQQSGGKHVISSHCLGVVTLFGHTTRYTHCELNAV